METLKAILKLQQLRDESVGTELINEESVVDVGKALYKFHIQLLLLLETANKMYNSLITAANQVQVMYSPYSELSNCRLVSGKDLT